MRRGQLTPRRKSPLRRSAISPLRESADGSGPAVGNFPTSRGFLFFLVLLGAAARCVQFGLSLVLRVVARRLEAPAPALGLLASLWGLGAGFAVWSGERMLTPRVRSYLEVFWASGFMPLSPTAAASWLWRRMVGLFAGFLDYRLPPYFVALLVVGAVGLSRRRPVAALFLLVPLLLVIAASAARLYPFAPSRVTAFLVPRLIFDYLDRIGRPLEHSDFRFHGSFSPVVLASYDLSDPARLSAVTSETFPVQAPPEASLTGLPCEGTMGALPATLAAR